MNWVAFSLQAVGNIPSVLLGFVLGTALGRLVLPSEWRISYSRGAIAWIVTLCLTTIALHGVSPLYKMGVSILIAACVAFLASKPRRSPSVVARLKGGVPGVSQKPDQDRWYERALEELEANQLAKALWARALVESQGEQTKARALYIRLRVDQLRKMDEVRAHESREELLNALRETEARQKLLRDERDASFWTNAYKGFRIVATNVGYAVIVNGEQVDFPNREAAYDHIDNLTAERIQTESA